MDRNREARRATNMAAPPNGLSSRRRHRSTRDSPDEDGGGIEIQERLRDRGGGVVKKDRDRDRERERSIRSKRRRENRLIHNQNQNNQNHNNQNNHHNHHNHVTAGDADDTSEESVNDEEGEDEDDAGNAPVRMLPPPPSNPSTNNNHHHINLQQQQQQQQLHHRKTFPPPANKVFRSSPAAPQPPPPAWKAAADEMIGVSVPRKARSASTKRSHEWISGGGGGGGHEQISRQLSTSPVNLAASPAPLAAPPSPSSSNISVRKKMKAANGGGGGGGSKPRPPKSSSKSSSSNPEELEIEIAEVLYGLMTQSQAAPSKKENDSNNKSSSDNKSRVSSPISNSTVPLTSLSTVAPKRKRPRQVSENPFSRSSSVSPSIKNEIDHQHQHHPSPKTDLEDNCQVSAATGENCVSFGFASLPSDPPSEKPEQDGKCGVDVGLVLNEQEVENKSHAVGLNDGNTITQTVITTPASLTTTNINLETTSQKEEKFEIDLMAPPPQLRTFPERDEDDVAFSDHKQMATQETSKNKDEEKLRKVGKEETMNLTEEQKKSKTASVQETGESLTKQQVVNEDRNIGLHIDLEKPSKDSANLVSGSSNRSLHQALKHQQLSAKSETHTEKTAQPSSMQMPMSVANWPPMGYVAPLQGVISMDGNTMPSAPIQPIFTHPRPKRCATHCYIARNIHYLQQFMKINPFWPAASGSTPMFGAKPCGLNVTELGHANIPQSTQDKGGHGVDIFPGHTAGKDNKSSQVTTIPDSAQRKQQVLLQQALPPVTPNNILHGPAFIFPFNQQQAAAAASASASASASVRPGSSKVNNNTSTAGAVGLVPGASGSANSATVGASATAAAPALSFNYPNMSANETQYLAILQNNPYTFPIPAVGAPPNYRGNPHGQPMPLFNGPFYSSQMIHPSQIPQPPQQQAPPSQSQNHHPSQSQQISQTHQNSSGSTSSSQRQQQQQQQQRQQQQQGSGVAVNGGGSLHNSYPVSHKSRSQPSQHMNPPPPQARHLENEVTGGEDSPSTADSRVSRAANTMSVYGHNFAMPVHSQNFAMMNPQAAMSNATAGGNPNDKKHQQQSQQQGSKRSGGSGLESASLPPQTFAMSFAPMNGTTGAMAQNHAIFQSLPESLRQSYHHMIQTAPASANHSQQKKDFRVSEEASRTINHDSSNAEEDRKGSAGMTGKSGQSIAFSRPDLSTDAPGSTSAILGTSVIDSSSRNINLGSNNNRSSRSPISTSVATAQSSHHHLHAQFQQQQQVLQLQKTQQQHQQQQQNMNARSKNPISNNGSAYPDHLMTSSSSMAAAKFPNSISSFPQNLVQTGNTTSSPGQSPQWRNSVRGGPTTSQVPSSLSSATTSSLKNLHQSHQAQQQQSSRPHPQSHTQISFGTTSQKLQSTTSLQMQQQQQNQNLGSNGSNQSPSPPMLVGSPTTSSISKGGGGGGGGGVAAAAGGGSPRTNAGSASSGRAGQAASLSSSQQAKNSPVGTQRSSPSILGNPHNPNSTKSQQQLPKQSLQQQQAQAQAQAHMFFTHPYMQVQQPQAQQHSGTTTTTTSGYYLPRKQQQLQQSSQPQQSSSSSSSTAMLSLCLPVTLANTATTTTSDPAKAIAAATSNLKGGVGQGILHAAQYSGATQSSMPAGFPQYNAPHNNAPASVQVKPTEQKQPAGNDTLRTWQPEKK